MLINTVRNGLVNLDRRFNESVQTITNMQYDSSRSIVQEFNDLGNYVIQYNALAKALNAESQTIGQLIDITV